jgi:ABC-type nitrate/sulfonate/bicarbonate transport system substrate-binding protein
MLGSAFLSAVCLSVLARAGEPFADSVGPVTVGNVARTDVMEVPYITWGGDVATFHANGGLATQNGSIYKGHGLNLKLVAGDDFPAQVRRYLSGQTPFLRGTISMIGLASEVVGKDPRTQPVVFLIMTWSAGDHMVGRSHVKNLNDLKGKKIVLQQGGPHVGMLDDVLRTARLKWSDVNVVWVSDLTGDKGPAAQFRKDASIDCCFVISPDMIGLTGGLDSTGSGAEGSVKDAHVVVSTNTMRRSIADVYACRKDFFDANKPLVEKFTAGYLKGSEELVALKQEYDSAGQSPRYMNILKLTQQIYGPDVIPTLDVDAHGLVSDAQFLGLPGNVVFFTQKGNLNGFEAKQKQVLDLAVGEGYAKIRSGFFGPDWDYARLKQLGKLTQEATIAGETAAEGFVDLDTVHAEGTLYSFTIKFEPDQVDFPSDVYGSQFQEVLQQASTFKNAVIAIRGHADPTMTLRHLLEAGMSKGILNRTGTNKQNYKYFLKGRPLDLTRTDEIVALIQAGEFSGTTPDPQATMQAALNLSLARSEAVREAVVKFASDNQIVLDAQQLGALGIGIREPVIKKPTSLEEAKENMRVEFRLMRVKSEAGRAEDFDF